MNLEKYSDYNSSNKNFELEHDKHDIYSDFWLNVLMASSIIAVPTGFQKSVSTLPNIVNVSNETKNTNSVSINIDERDSTNNPSFVFDDHFELLSEVIDMSSKATKEDLSNAQTFIFNEMNKGFDNVTNQFKEEKNTLKEQTSRLNKLEENYASLSQQIKDLPEKLKARKWDTFINRFLIPLIIGIIGAVIGAIFKK